ncbi:hypothetical protein [Campylobacter ureolyticus]|uniref:Uncharacterized protein n=1 Tax=Campylobacter ureolyticus TaxID=827 RepID=A0AAE7EBD9_9BACT|nr:hypothetical protein [Campylobacter ureolyticus]MCR8685371.1 hypothetical protein [Campylobacter ureolyticus]QKF85052.1 hypothetical protein CURT_1617 [Campylobacter ureolyticus]QQY36456.1 hypothetical protein I6I59_04345 [Campylobacter ureolyticus]SUX19863.1 Uncharacterised protein [Campylobacter ureolyticus]
MFLNKFKDDKLKENFIKLAGIIYDDSNIIESYICESGLSLDVNEISDECQDILSLKDDKDEFEDEILDLLENADINFYIEFLMLINLIPSKLTNDIKSRLEEKLNLSDEKIMTLNNWAINTASHINNAVKIISSVKS